MHTVLPATQSMPVPTQVLPTQQPDGQVNALQAPPLQVPLLQVPNPEPHDNPDPIQALLTQQPPDEHVLFAQQGCPEPPQATHTLLPLQMVPCWVHAPPRQHACPA